VRVEPKAAHFGLDVDNVLSLFRLPAPLFDGSFSRSLRLKTEN